jgi:hypothetical protein
VVLTLRAPLADTRRRPRRFSFSVDPAISGNPTLKVVYLDIAENSTWSAAFRHASGVMATAMRVTTSGSGRYVTAEAQLRGATFGPEMTSVDLVIENEDDKDDIFSFVELVKSKG